MRGKLATVAVLTVAAAACTTEAIPATTPPSTSATTTTVTPTVPPATTTTTTVATTTTLDRLVEIEAIFQDLEERRLQALYEGDREAFQSLFANEEYMERSMGAFEVVEFVREPIVEIEVVSVLHDSGSCIAVVRVFHRVDTGQTAEQTIGVIEDNGEGWGMSYVGEGWACDGPHPFSP
ncbi:MAG: hypothetical protein WCC01_08305 [Acidimicrobiia bacterium]